MSVHRVSYDALPVGTRAAIEQITGTPITVEPVAEGFNSAVGVKLASAKGHFFVKALRSGNRWSWTQAREAEVAPHVHAVAPKLHGRVVKYGWDVLVFEMLQGSVADYSPSSFHVPVVVDLLTQMSEIPRPDIELRDAGQRLQAYVRPGSVHHFIGDSLLHTDLNNANIIVYKGKARIVDWGWATRGAPWLDAAYWVIWLIASGHQPPSAERWASKVPTWQITTGEGLNEFATANARLWSHIGKGSTDPWTERMVDASAEWEAFRLRC
ncbi:MULTISPECIES: protein kinase family protein [Catenuloplanes]|uniref:Aminoglycoside phosphotransferase n=1 Tax=Catenuloplanes niger TaxID=587534 RepID=A0AAE4CSP3_9ACTN|nr:hypothetical protein [Catenuloplanes niger]MDR7324416.1 hypothetical protein [Catenuloplanes niger]